MSVHRIRTALIGLDYIVDIMHPEGKIARSAPMAAERAIVQRFNHAKIYAEQHDWITILVKVGFEPTYFDQPKRSPVFGRANEIGALDLSGPGTDFHPDLIVSDCDIVITKPRVNAFFGTRLAPILSAAGVERLVIGGVSTSMAVQSTVRDAHDRDFEVIVLEDACAAATPRDHEDSIEMLRALATITTVPALAALA